MSLRPVRIALLAPLISPIRQPYLGGAQAMLRDLSVTLAKRGHDVTLYAAAGSDPEALPGVRLVSLDVDASALRPADLSGREPAPLYTADSAMETAFAVAYRSIATRADEHDLIHAHAYDAPAFTLGAQQRLPIAHTLHMPDIHASISATLSILAPPSAPRAPSQPWLITVSQWCAGTYASTCRIDVVIPNGVDLHSIPFADRPADPPYLLFAGRIAPEKGAADAIAIARAAGYRLIIAGGVYDQEYFSERIQPSLMAHPDAITLLGPLTHSRVWSLMAGATAVLVPSQWEEPFGLAACEAQAAGAPVIAYARGGLRDIIADGETGVLIPPGDIAAAAASLPRVARMSRRACRERVAARFTLHRMAAAYEELYHRILGT
jgi:glycosyltransferase involved in cell wall biosynthesis